MAMPTLSGLLAAIEDARQRAGSYVADAAEQVRDNPWQDTAKNVGRGVAVGAGQLADMNPFQAQGNSGSMLADALKSALGWGDTPVENITSLAGPPIKTAAAGAAKVAGMAKAGAPTLAMLLHAAQGGGRAADALGELPDGIRAVVRFGGKEFDGATHIEAMKKAAAAGLLDLKAPKLNREMGDTIDLFSVPGKGILTRDEVGALYDGAKRTEDLRAGEAARQAEADAPVTTKESVPSGAAGAVEEAPAAAVPEKSRVWTPSTGSLFDLTKLHENPSYMTDQALQRLAPPKKGIPDYVQSRIDTLGDTYNPLVERGLQNGGREWYNQEPLRKIFLEELGPEEGAKRFDMWNQFIAATSPGMGVGRNQKLASYLQAQYGQGNLGIGRALDPTGRMELPTGYNHQYQGQVNEKLADILNNGSLNSELYPKTSGFGANLSGNYTPVAIDRHVVRGIDLVGKNGKPLEAPEGAWYGSLEAKIAEEARKMGVTPEQYQAGGWIGGADQTNVTDAAPFMQILQRQMIDAAQKTGKTPAQFLREFVHGTEFLR